MRPAGFAAGNVAYAQGLAHLAGWASMRPAGFAAGNSFFMLPFIGGAGMLQ